MPRELFGYIFRESCLDTNFDEVIIYDAVDISALYTQIFCLNNLSMVYSSNGYIIHVLLDNFIAQLFLPATLSSAPL